MTPKDVYDYFGSAYRFNKITKIAANSLLNWMRWGFVPENAQYKVERLTNGALKTQWTKTINEESNMHQMQETI